MRTLVLAMLSFAACDRVAPNAAHEPAAQLLAVLDRGAEALGESQRHCAAGAPAAPPPSLRPPPDPFCRYDGRVRAYLLARSRVEATRNDGVIVGVCDEIDVLQRWLEDALDARDPVVRLRALVALVHVREADSIDRQLHTLRTLRSELAAPAFAPVFARLAAAFDPATIEAGLVAPWDGARQRWAVRLAALVHHLPAVPQLARIAGAGRAHVRHLAAKGLATFDSWHVDEVLADMLGGDPEPSAWAFFHLLRRNPHRLCSLLQATDSKALRQLVRNIPAVWRDASCVPAFCATVGTCPGCDDVLFAMIEGLALPEHRALVEFLPRRVGSTHRARAIEVVAAVGARCGW